MEDASSAIADYNTRLGLTGENLQGVSKQALQVSDLLGEDLSGVIEGSSQAFQQWNIDADGMEGQTPSKTLEIPRNGNFEYTDNAAKGYGKATAKNGGFTGNFDSGNGLTKELVRVLKVQIASQTEADRFAKGILRDANKDATTGTFWTSGLLREYAAGSVADVQTSGASSWPSTTGRSRPQPSGTPTRSRPKPQRWPPEKGAEHGTQHSTPQTKPQTPPTAGATTTRTTPLPAS